MAKRMTRNSNLCCKKNVIVRQTLTWKQSVPTFSQFFTHKLSHKLRLAYWLAKWRVCCAANYWRRLRTSASDQTIDQTLNRHAKISGDIIGVSLRPAAVQKWMLTAHVHHRAALIHSCQEQTSVDHSSGHLHKDWHMTRLRADKMVVQDVTWLAQPSLNNILKRQTWLLSDRPGSTIIAAILDDANFEHTILIKAQSLFVCWLFIGKP